MLVPFRALFDLFILLKVCERTFHHFSGTLGGSFSLIRNKQPAFSVPLQALLTASGRKTRFLEASPTQTPQQVGSRSWAGLGVTSRNGRTIREYQRGTCRHPQSREDGRVCVPVPPSICCQPCPPTPACFFSSLSGPPCGKVRVSCERFLQRFL